MGREVASVITRRTWEGTERASKSLRRAMDWMAGREGGGAKGRNPGAPGEDPGPDEPDEGPAP